MISHLNCNEFELRKRELYNTFKTTLNEKISTNFEQINKITFVIIDNTLSIIVDGVLNSKEWFTPEFSKHIASLTLSLKQMSSDIDYGGWLSCEMVIDHNNDAFIYYFNFDEFKPFMQKFSSKNFAHELIFFPRTNIGTPEWMKSILANHDSSQDFSSWLLN